MIIISYQFCSLCYTPTLNWLEGILNIVSQGLQEKGHIESNAKEETICSSKGIHSHLTTPSGVEVEYGKPGHSVSKLGEPVDHSRAQITKFRKNLEHNPQHAKGHIVFKLLSSSHPHFPKGSQDEGASGDAAQGEDQHATPGDHDIVAPLCRILARISPNFLLLDEQPDAFHQLRYLLTTPPHPSQLEERGEAAGQGTEGIHGIHWTGSQVTPAEDKLRLAAVSQIHEIKDQP